MAIAALEKVVKVNIFLSDMSFFADMNEEYAKWFTTKPARSCVAVRQLVSDVSEEYAQFYVADTLRATYLAKSSRC